MDAAGVDEIQRAHVEGGRHRRLGAGGDQSFGELDAAVPVIEAAVDVGRRNGGQGPGAE